MWEGRVGVIFILRCARDGHGSYLEMAISLGMGLLLYSAPRVKALPETALGLKAARFLADEKFVPYAQALLE